MLTNRFAYDNIISQTGRRAVTDEFMRNNRRERHIKSLVVRLGNFTAV